MTIIALSTAYLCADCDTIGDDSSRCTLCGSSSLLNLATVLNRKEPEKKEQVQTDGPRCKKCRAFTTKTRVETHGLCMRCELEAKGN